MSFPSLFALTDDKDAWVADIWDPLAKRDGTLVCQDPLIIGEGKKDHLVSWDIVCNPKVKGGLGFGNISLRNLALREIVVKVP